MITIDDNIKRIINRDVDPKSLPALLKVLPINIKLIKEQVEANGYTFISERCLVYNKFMSHIRLTANPQMGDQIIKVVRFDPKCIQDIIQLGYYTTGHCVQIRGEYDLNILVVAKDETNALLIKGSLDKIDK